MKKEEEWAESIFPLNSDFAMFVGFVQLVYRQHWVEPQGHMSDMTSQRWDVISAVLYFSISVLSNFSLLLHNISKSNIVLVFHHTGPTALLVTFHPLPVRWKHASLNLMILDFNLTEMFLYVLRRFSRISCKTHCHKAEHRVVFMSSWF